MNKDKRFSDEFLNAFVDNQLAPEEKSRAYDEISRDETVNRQVCELRKLHDLVQLAYRDVPAPPARTKAPHARRRRFGAVAAAAAVLTVGVVMGLQIEPRPKQEQIQTTRHATPAVKATAAKAPAKLAGTVQHAAVAHAITPKPTVAKPAPVTRTIKVTRFTETTAPRSINDVHIGNVRNKVLIHIAHDDQEKLAQALDEIEGLMRYYQEVHQSAHVEVVINGRGMELVRIDTSEHAARIAKLQKEYDNLTFAACQNTIDRLKREQGITVRLLPGVVITDSGMAEIMRRQHQGWTYLQV